jgi:hypothetical protein
MRVAEVEIVLIDEVLSAEADELEVVSVSNIAVLRVGMASETLLRDSPDDVDTLTDPDREMARVLGVILPEDEASMTVPLIDFSGFEEGSLAEVVVSAVLDVDGLEVLGFDDVGVVAAVDMALLGGDGEEVVPGVVARETVASDEEIELILSPMGDCA